MTEINCLIRNQDININEIGHVDKKYLEVAYPGDIEPEKFTSFHEFIVCDELSRSGSGGFCWGKFYIHFVNYNFIN